MGEHLPNGKLAVDGACENSIFTLPSIGCNATCEAERLHYSSNQVWHSPANQKVKGLS